MKAVLLATVGGLLVAVGAALVYVPAGLIAAGVEVMAGAYVTAYLEHAREERRL